MSRGPPRSSLFPYTTLFRFGRGEEAAEALATAVELDPRNTLAWGNRAVALNNLGRFDEALEAAKTATEVDAKSAFAWVQVGFARKSLGLNSEDAHTP